MIQHRAARFVMNKPWRRNQRDSITNIISNLNWPTLQERRRSARLVLLDKILHNLLIIPNSYLPMISSVSRTRNSHIFKLTPYQPRIDLYKYSFLPRTVLEWNRLDDEVIEVDGIEQFKLKNIIAKKFDKIVFVYRHYTPGGSCRSTINK